MINTTSPAVGVALQDLVVQMTHTANLVLEVTHTVSPAVGTNLAVERGLWEASQQRPDLVTRTINTASQAADVLAKGFRAPNHIPVKAHHGEILEFLRPGNFVEFIL